MSKKSEKKIKSKKTEKKIVNSQIKESKNAKNNDIKCEDKTSTNASIDSNYEKSFNLERFCKVLVILIGIICLIIACVKIKKSLNDLDSFHSVSLKASKDISNKNDAMNNAYGIINDLNNKNEEIGPTNLNLALVKGNVVDDEEASLLALERQLPVPITMDEEKEPEVDNDSVAFKIFKKLQSRYQILNQSLYNLCDMKPVLIVRQYHYDGYSIIGKYNPEDSTHIKGKRHTYFIPNFSNVNIRYFDGDGNSIDEDNNIKDIMSMASIYTYYHDPYDSKTFLKYSNDLFDNSYTFVASISEVYYCSGCMHYDDPDLATDSDAKIDVTYDKITREHREQYVPEKEIPYKAGTLYKMKEDSYHINATTYDDYVNDIYNGKIVTTNNYCPGHIDLNIDVTVKTLDSINGLVKIDKNYGNKGVNYNKNWHGWDALMLSRARELANKDWEKEYGISLSYINFVKPLTQEEINYYLNRLPGDITPNRRKLIDTALKSVGKIPYYYGGKTFRGGYEANGFGQKVSSDYKGRCLKGLDCSGWINWVYLTAFDKYIIKSEGTSKLATEGTKITRKDLLPGDIIVRPGIDSHVMMFLEWAPGGKMKVIHENGSVNNVSIGTFDAYYPHYRRILNS